MHIDEWIDRTHAPDEEHYAMFFFMLHRLDATSKLRWAPWISQYKLFCTWKGKRYRAIGCSRLGDVWLTKNFNRTHGYDVRVDVTECSGWSATA